MRSMFDLAGAFNGNIGQWDVSAVTDFSALFSNASSFDQDIGSWDVSSGTNMALMFEGATLFDQDLSDWCVPQFPSEPSFFSLNSALSTANHPVWGTCGGYNPDSAYVNSRGCMVCDQYAAGDTFSWILERHGSPL